MSSSIHIHLQSAPLDCKSALSGFDMALVYAAFEQETKLFFSSDGVYHLIETAPESNWPVRQFQNQLIDWDMFELSGVVVRQSDLVRRKLEPDQLVVKVTTLSDYDFSTLLPQGKQVFNF